MASSEWGMAGRVPSDDPIYPYSQPAIRYSPLSHVFDPVKVRGAGLTA
jgi:hypothetical protein